MKAAPPKAQATNGIGTLANIQSAAKTQMMMIRWPAVGRPTTSYMQSIEKERELYSVMGWNSQGHTVALIIAKSEAGAEYYALHELGLVKLDSISLVSDCVHVALDETKE